MKTLIVVLLLGLASTGAVAQSTGSAVVPHYTFSGQNNSNTLLYLTNTTNSMLEVDITVRSGISYVVHDDGNIIGGSIQIWNTLYASEPTSGPGPSAKLTMRPGGTSEIWLKPKAVNNGYTGTIKIDWTSPENVSEAMFAHARVVLKEGTTSESSYSVHVNNGQSF
ncbi:hypothetical protein ACSLBF_18925 (plasmid) [Pseudoalteromonas sp. T1lg65]|uniref:hypothetical protein n=1 Tax=Pseudoalteromonas sp. T1lg65 TaxID=2077101 RepID=UPI003F7AC7F9